MSLLTLVFNIGESGFGYRKRPRRSSEESLQNQRLGFADATQRLKASPESLAGETPAPQLWTSVSAVPSAADPSYLKPRRRLYIHL